MRYVVLIAVLAIGLWLGLKGLTSTTGTVAHGPAPAVTPKTAPGVANRVRSQVQASEAAGQATVNNALNQADQSR
jgi:hypothetical protein